MLSIPTLVGFITLFGIAVRNGILLVSHYYTLLGEGLPLGDGAAQPVLMTALLAGLALIPLAPAGG